MFSDNGREILRKTGDANGVGFDQNEALLLKDAIVTHNHPVISSFSIEDVLLLLRRDLQELRAVDSRYRYSMKRPADGWAPGEREQALQMAEEVEAEVWGIWLDRLLRGELSQSEFSAGIYHAIWETLAQRIRLLYQRIER